MSDDWNAPDGTDWELLQAEVERLKRDVMVTSNEKHALGVEVERLRAENQHLRDFRLVADKRLAEENERLRIEKANLEVLLNVNYATAKAAEGDVERLEEVAAAARIVLGATPIFPAKYPHVGTLRDAVLKLDAQLIDGMGDA
jgi:regulator of replication initiation timing